MEKETFFMDAEDGSFPQKDRLGGMKIPMPDNVEPVVRGQIQGFNAQIETAMQRLDNNEEVTEEKITSMNEARKKLFEAANIEIS